MESKRKIQINSIPLANSILIESYCDNIIITSKYNLANFIFQSSLNQLQRIANTYFVIITIIILLQNCITNWNNLIQGLILLSGFFIILIVSVSNDLYSDYKKHQYDFYVSHKLTNLIDPITMNSSAIYWKDVKVGDLIKIQSNEDIPADMILVESSSKDNKVSIELNQKFTDLVCSDCNEIKSIINKQCVVYDCKLKRIFIECIQPTSNLNHFEGNLYTSNNSRNIPITVTNLIYRSSILINTEWIIGAVIYTGIETKIALKNKLKNNSETNTAIMDRLINISLIVLLLSQGITSIIELTANQLNSMTYMTLLLVNIVVSVVFLTLEILKLKQEYNEYSISKNIDLFITSETICTKNNNNNNNIVVNRSNSTHNHFKGKIADSFKYTSKWNHDMI